MDLKLELFPFILQLPQFPLLDADLLLHELEDALVAFDHVLWVKVLVVIHLLEMSVNLPLKMVFLLGLVECLRLHLGLDHVCSIKLSLVLHFDLNQGRLKGLNPHGALGPNSINSGQELLLCIPELDVLTPLLGLHLSLIFLETDSQLCCVLLHLLVGVDVLLAPSLKHVRQCLPRVLASPLLASLIQLCLNVIDIVAQTVDVLLHLLDFGIDLHQVTVQQLLDRCDQRVLLSFLVLVP